MITVDRVLGIGTKIYPKLMIKDILMKGHYSLTKARHGLFEHMLIMRCMSRIMRDENGTEKKQEADYFMRKE